LSKRPLKWSVLVTAEHGGNDVPEEYRELFRSRENLLESHWGWDPGTLALARSLARARASPSVTSTVTRLLVDLNRSPHNPRVFSEVTRALPRGERLAILERFHRPHWDRARSAVSRGIREIGRTLHLGVHSFTPLLGEEIRRPDIALLYDPSRTSELELASAWAGALSEALPDLVVRRNNPYRGAADGMTTAFRHLFPVRRYAGIEIEINQRHVGRDSAFPPWVPQALVSTLRPVIAD
jgi:predicted N-formylglutamate amidohydrolase